MSTGNVCRLRLMRQVVREQRTSAQEAGEVTESRSPRGRPVSRNADGRHGILVPTVQTDATGMRTLPRQAGQRRSGKAYGWDRGRTCPACRRPPCSASRLHYGRKRSSPRRTSSTWPSRGSRRSPNSAGRPSPPTRGRASRTGWPPRAPGGRRRTSTTTTRPRSPGPPDPDRSRPATTTPPVPVGPGAAARSADAGAQTAAGPSLRHIRRPYRFPSW
jgi:hypothetical protein